jgi:hypothetical protein
VGLPSVGLSSNVMSMGSSLSSGCLVRVLVSLSLDSGVSGLLGSVSDLLLYNYCQRSWSRFTFYNKHEIRLNLLTPLITGIEAVSIAFKS